MLSEKYHKLRMLCLMIIYSSFLVFLLHRLVLSVELTDEIHGIASIYNIYLGNVPFMTSWDYHTGWCLLTPLFRLFHKVSPNLEGCVLFFRCTYIIFAFLVSVIIAWLLYRKTLHKNLFFLATTSVFYVSASIFQINYNSFTVFVMLLVAVMLYVSDQEKQERLYYISIGILMGMVCITYPTFMIGSVVLAIFIYTEHKKHFGKEKTFYYCLGGILTAIIFMGWIFRAGGGISLFWDGLNGMLSSPHEKTKGAINWSFFIQTFYRPMKAYFFRAYSGVWIVFVILEWMISNYVKTGKKLWSRFIFLALLMIQMLSEQKNYGSVVLGNFIGFMIFTAFERNKLWKKYKVFFIIFILSILTYSFTSDNKNIMVVFETIGPSVFFLISFLSEIEYSKSSRFFGIIVAILLSFSGLIHSYTYVYRDEPVTQLTERVEYGIYKGLYTTPERKRFVEEMENVLTDYIMPSEKICAVTRVPMVYLMSKAKTCVPQTWDAQFLARGYTSSSPLLEYFQAMGEIPDILIATDMDVPDFYNNSKYEIHEFIEEKYELYYTCEIEGVCLYLWRRI